MNNQKPLTVIIEELKGKMIETINEAQIHIAIVKPIVDELKREIDMQYKMAFKQEAEMYKASKEEPQSEDPVES
ncbi:MAG: hypothetical protein WAO49_09175 [Arcanobacterium sp.]